LDGARSRSNHLSFSSVDSSPLLLVYIATDYISPLLNFPEKYFEWVANGVIPQGEFLVLRRSKTYNLSKADARVEASRVIIGMMRYINRD
jgi:hypothetical protein